MGLMISWARGCDAARILKERTFPTFNVQISKQPKNLPLTIQFYLAICSCTTRINSCVMVIVYVTKSTMLPMALISLLFFNFALTFPLPLNDHPSAPPLFSLLLPRTASSITQSASDTSTSGASTSPTPTHPSFSTVQPQWDLQEISTVVFGCIASVLGVLALLTTVWLGRRSTGSAGGTSNGTTEGNDLELEDPPDTQDEATPATDQGPVPSERRLA
ncbi:hypothetical protein N7G274_008355 [Stereocaulon virgatum]|uniref:Uncharacterized protein n=1 Tax=Stereocaulon virgatum TaxID=373712 RepID=A0ABR3ZZL9_9LECA